MSSFAIKFTYTHIYFSGVVSISTELKRLLYKNVIFLKDLLSSSVTDQDTFSHSV